MSCWSFIKKSHVARAATLYFAVARAWARRRPRSEIFVSRSPHQNVPKLVRNRQRSARPDRVREKRVRPVERVDKPTISNLRPPVGLHRAGELEGEFVVVAPAPASLPTSEGWPQRLMGVRPSAKSLSYFSFTAPVISVAITPGWISNRSNRPNSPSTKLIIRSRSSALEMSPWMISTRRSLSISQQVAWQARDEVDLRQVAVEVQTVNPQPAQADALVARIDRPNVERERGHASILQRGAAKGKRRVAVLGERS